MNSLLALLFWSNVAIIMATSVNLGDGEPPRIVPPEIEDERPKDDQLLPNREYVKECKEVLKNELNLTYLECKDHKMLWLPYYNSCSCLVDCYYHKLGVLFQKNNSAMVEYALVSSPNFDYYKKNISDPYTFKLYQSINLCRLILESQRYERCHFMYHYRRCIIKRMEAEDYEAMFGNF
ncbi:uncharacterized protein LOC135842439 [Planococcus citri]|uniref:uncharacterized protein LOC135842439 n=1 Tax=Planococcus citri TaxID=170843 RepID=UPI0031F98559